MIRHISFTLFGIFALIVGCSPSTNNRPETIEPVKMPLSLVISKAKESALYTTPVMLSDEQKERLGINDGVYVLYLANLTCSVCLFDYIKFSRFMTSEYACPFDSVVTLAYGDNSFITMEYYMERDKVERIENERILIDDMKLSLTQSVLTTSENNNFIYIEDGQILFACNFSALNGDKTGNLFVDVYYQ